MDLCAVMREVVIGLFPAYRLQLLRQKKRKSVNINKMLQRNTEHISLAHHVVPQGNGHFSMSSLTDVETVHREETGVSLTLLVKKINRYPQRECIDTASLVYYE